MRQVPAFSHDAVGRPARFLLIGDGRLARHLSHYLALENLAFDQWSRKSAHAFANAPAHRSGADLRSLFTVATHVLVAISDQAIESFVSENAFLLEKPCVHFSGALSLSSMASAHPLMAFATDLYPLETYRAIPFVLETGRGGLVDYLPGLTNQSSAIPSSAKLMYHALCVMSGNFTVLLWEKVFAEFSQTLGLSRDLLYPYLAQIAANLIRSPEDQSVLTGPLARQDFATIEKHLAVLGDDPFADVYRAFVKAHTSSFLRSEPLPFPLGGLV